MIVFPLRSDRRLHHLPVVNWLLIAANVLIFAAVFQQAARLGVSPAEVMQSYMLHPARPRLYQFLTYQFLHAGWMHILGNMVVLYIFGQHVEDRLGKVGYLAFYLAGGVIAALGHSLVEGAGLFGPPSDAPVLGASGAVSAVTGAYLALFPLSNITVFYWLFLFIGVFEIPSLLLILYQVAQNVFFQLSGAPGVAYLAHLAGYAFGFAVGMGLLGTRLLPREPYDLLSMLEHRRRRAAFRALTREGYQPWEGRTAADAPAGMRAQPLDERGQRLHELRGQIAAALNAGALPQAAAHYQTLLDLDGGQVLGQQAQLDVANQLMSEGRYETAARAYELFLNTYRQYPQREQIELILGLVYTRYLNRRQRAIELLNTALPRLQDRDQRDLAQQLLAQTAG